MDATTVGVDLAKNVFEIALADSRGHIVERQRLTRARFDRFFVNRTACRIRNRRRRHDSNMNLRKKRTPRASQHYVGWRARQKSLLLPVAGEVFLLTLPFIERSKKQCP